MKQIDTISGLTGELHDDITNIWEELVDQNYNEVDKMIVETIYKLKHLKSNLINSPEI